MTAKTDDPARRAVAEATTHPLLYSLVFALSILRHVHLHVPKTLNADPRNVAGMLGKAIETLEIVEREMTFPVRRDDER